MKIVLLGNKARAAKFKAIAIRMLNAGKRIGLNGQFTKWAKLSKGVLVGLKSLNGMDTIIIRATGLVCLGWYLVTMKLLANKPFLPGSFLSTLMLHFKSDGTQLYINSFVDNEVVSFDLPAAWEASGMVHNTTLAMQSVIGSVVATTMLGGTFSTDGTLLFSIQLGKPIVFEMEIQTYSLSTAWDISTATIASRFPYPSGLNFARDIQFSTDGLKMYILGTTPNKILEYDLSSPWVVATAAFVSEFEFPFIGVSVYFQAGGSHMYVMGILPNHTKYALPTKWNVSSAVLVENLPLIVPPMQKGAWFFRPDGQRMYRLGVPFGAPTARIHTFGLCLPRAGG